MTPTEASDMMELIRRRFPHQQFDEQEALLELVETVGAFSAADVRVAVRQETREQEFLSWARLRALVVALRADRWRRVTEALRHEPLPRVDPDNVGAYLAEQRALRMKVLAGDWDAADVAVYEAGQGPALSQEGAGAALASWVGREVAPVSAAQRAMLGAVLASGADRLALPAGD